MIKQSRCSSGAGSALIFALPDLFEVCWDTEFQTQSQNLKMCVSEPNSVCVEPDQEPDEILQNNPCLLVGLGCWLACSVLNLQILQFSFAEMKLMTN